MLKAASLRNNVKYCYSGQCPRLLVHFIHSILHQYQEAPSMFLENETKRALVDNSR